MKLTDSDYKLILKFYKIPLNKKNLTNKKSIAENILATKLCRCIKKVKKNSTQKNTVGICSKSIFLNRNLKYSRFSCKNNYKLIKSKKNKKLYKSKKNLKFYKS